MLQRSMVAASWMGQHAERLGCSTIGEQNFGTRVNIDRDVLTIVSPSRGVAAPGRDGPGEGA